MKKLSLTAVLLTTAIALTACGSNDNSSNTNNAATGNNTPAATEQASGDVTVLKVARNAVPNPPFSYVDENNKMTGYTVEYLELVDERLEQYEFDYEEIAREAMLAGVEAGKYDFAANFYYRTADREAKYLFGDVEYGYSLNGIIVKEDRDDIHSLDDLQGKTLTPLSPSMGLRSFVVDYNEQHADNPIIYEDIDAITEAEAMQWVAEGKYDAFLTNKTVFENVNKELNLPLKIATFITKEPVWVLFNQEKTELAAEFDKVTQELIEDGTLPALSEKYFGVDMFQSLEEVNAAE